MLAAVHVDWAQVAAFFTVIGFLGGFIRWLFVRIERAFKKHISESVGPRLDLIDGRLEGIDGRLDDQDRVLDLQSQAIGRLERNGHRPPPAPMQRETSGEQ